MTFLNNDMLYYVKCHFDYPWLNVIGGDLCSILKCPPHWLCCHVDWPPYWFPPCWISDTIEVFCFYFSYYCALGAIPLNNTHMCLSFISLEIPRGFCRFELKLCLGPVVLCLSVALYH